MPSTTAAARKPPLPLLIVGALFLAALIGFGVYLSRPAHLAGATGPTEEAKAYLEYLALSDVAMKASENFMQQQVVEIEGKIANNGSRSIRRVDVSCIFRDVSGKPIYQERVPVVQGTTFAPGQVRTFRLPFDTLPDGWNQAMPNLVIAQILFAD
jgi:hypothetical protein